MLHILFFLVLNTYIEVYQSRICIFLQQMNLNIIEKNINYFLNMSLLKSNKFCLILFSLNLEFEININLI